MPTCSFTLHFKNKVQILSNSSLLSDIFKACIRTKPFQNIKSLKKHSIHGNKVQITLSVKQKIPKNKLNDAVKNVIHLLKKKKYQFKSTKTMKGGGKKNRRSTRKTRKQNGGILGDNYGDIIDKNYIKSNLRFPDIVSFENSETNDKYIFFFFNYIENNSTAIFTSGKASQRIDKNNKIINNPGGVRIDVDKIREARLFNK